MESHGRDAPDGFLVGGAKAARVKHRSPGGAMPSGVSGQVVKSGLGPFEPFGPFGPLSKGLKPTEFGAWASKNSSSDQQFESMMKFS